MLLRLSAQLHEPSGHAAIDATFFDRENASKHYCRRTNYRFQTLKATALVDTKPKPFWTFTVRPRNATTHSSTDDKGYDWIELREKLREDSVRPLIKHREFRPIDHAHNARIDGPRYWQRAMCKTVFSAIKRTLGDAVRARSWYGEFRELVLMCTVHNTKQAVKQ